jgi:cyanophycinase
MSSLRQSYASYSHWLLPGKLKIMGDLQKCPTPLGTLFIIGGKENKGQEHDGKVSDENFIPEEILKKFIEIIHKENPVVEIITSAGSDGEEAYKQYQQLFNKLEVQQVNHIHHNSRSEALKQPLTERINAADAFFISGGDQLKLTATYGGTPFLTELKNRYIYSSVIVAGTSAGAMALSTPMIYAGSQDEQQITSEIKITTGLEFLKDVCIDTHFVHRGRFVRMAQVVVTNPACMGIGIEEDTAIIVRNGIDGEIVGSGSVIIIEGFDINESNIAEFADKKALSIRNLTVHILSRDDKYTIPQANPPHI